MVLRATDFIPDRRKVTDMRTIGPLLLDLDVSRALGDGSVVDSSLFLEPEGADILAGAGAMTGSEDDWTGHDENSGEGEFSIAGGVMHIEAGSENEAPTITSSASLTAAENQTAIATLTATDPDVGDTLTWSKVGGADQAQFGLTTGGVLTFLVAKDMEAPIDANTDGIYVVDVRVMDQVGAYDDMTVYVTVTNVNEAPLNTVPGAQTTAENVAKAITGISIADVDNSSVSITLSVTHGTLTLAATTGLTFTVGDGTADSTMAFTGTKANVNTALATVTYTPTTDYVGSASFSLVTSDGSLSDTDNVAITVNADERQEIQFNPQWLGGVAKYSWNGFTTDVVNSNRTAEELLAAMAPLGFDSSNMEITVPVSPYDGYRFHFKGALGGSDQPQITWDGNIPGNMPAYDGNGVLIGELYFHQRHDTQNEKQDFNFVPRYPNAGGLLVTMPAGSGLTNADLTASSVPDESALAGGINTANGGTVVAATDQPYSGTNPIGGDTARLEYTHASVAGTNLALASIAPYGGDPNPRWENAAPMISISGADGVATIPEVPGTYANITFYMPSSGAGIVSVNGIPFWDYDANGGFGPSAAQIQSFMAASIWVAGVNVSDLGGGNFYITNNNVGTVSAPGVSNDTGPVGAMFSSFNDGTNTVPAIPGSNGYIDIVRTNFDYSGMRLQGMFNYMFSNFGWYDPQSFAHMTALASSIGGSTVTPISNGHRITLTESSTASSYTLYSSCYFVTCEVLAFQNGGGPEGAEYKLKWGDGYVGYLIPSWFGRSPSTFAVWLTPGITTLQVQTAIVNGLSTFWGLTPTVCSVVDEGAIWTLTLGFDYAEGDWTPYGGAHVQCAGGLPAVAHYS